MNRKKSAPPVVMVIGGMDPSGGAGLCADIQTLSALGCHAAPVVTAITVQDSSVVKSFELIDIDLLTAQMQTIIDDMSPQVIKTGMLGSRAIITAIADILNKQTDIQLIVDPVMSSNHHDNLSEHSLASSMVELLMPIAALITPNTLEAEELAFQGEDKNLGADKCAAMLSDLESTCDCLMTGSHADTKQVINRYYQQGCLRREWSWQRLSFDYHGSGCTLASAVAAGLANGRTMEQAIEQAQEYVHESLLLGFKPGRGQHFPDRLCRVSSSNASTG